MRPALLRCLVPVLSALLLASAAAADVLRIVATDARGVTLQVSTESWSLTAPDPDGRARVIGVPDAHSLADPGHALLPAYSTMLAVPADAHPTVRVLSADAPVLREGVRLAIAGRPSFHPGAGGDFEPGMTEVPALTDGAWPPQQALLGSVNSFRGRRLVGLEVRPFQYDEAAGTLRVTGSLVVRVDFNRPQGAAALAATSSAPDAHADAVLRSAVLNFDQAEPWRVAPAGQAAELFGRPAATPSGARAFDETQPEVRVTVDSTGVWALTYDLLRANGYPTGVPIAQVSVHRHEFLDGSPSQPYVTIEVPIEVEDANGNGSFDSGDRIWTYVRTWASRSGASHYQRWWGDAEVIFATAKPAGGLRMAVRNGWRAAASPVQLTSYPAFQHWEQNFAAILPSVNAATDTTLDIFHWTAPSFYYDRADTIAFTVNSIDTTHAVQFAVNWVGRDIGTHNEWAAVKNQLGQVTSVADSVLWNYKQPRTATAAIHGSALSEGINKLVTWGRDANTLPNSSPGLLDNVGFNWFEATYWRRFEAVHDVLAFNSAGQEGEIQVHATGFLADSLRVYDVTDPENPVRLHVAEAQVQRGATLSLDLQDFVATGETRSYVIAAAQEPLDPDFGPRQPAADHVARVTRLALASEPAADYIMIVPEAFLSAVQPLAALRRSLGMHVVVATAEDVYDEFNGGRPSAAALRRFAKYAYNRWSTRFLLLVGDATLDPLNNGGLSGRDWIPTNPVAGPVKGTGDYEITVSDNIYGCLTGNCDPINTFDYVIPELMIGRLPVNSLADAQAVVSKIVTYENLAGDQAWRRHLMLCSDDAYSSDPFVFGSGTASYCFKSYELFFQALNQKTRSIVLRDAGLSQMNVENWNLRYYLANEPVVGDTCRPDMQATRTRTHAGVTPQLFSSLNSGALWWSFQGHANEFVLTHEDLYINSQDTPGSDDKWLFANTNMPVIFTAFSCHANMFARANGAPFPQGVLGGSLGEDMVTLPQRGAVASWASTCYEIVPRDDSTHISVELARSMFASPPRDAQLYDHGSRVVLGEAIQAAYLRFLPGTPSYPSERGIAITYALLGDPAMRVSIGRPETIVYANGTIVTDGQPVRLHTTGDSLTLVADLVSTVRLDSLGLYVNSGGPDTPIPASQYSLSPAFPDTVGGGTYGGRRFRLTYGTHLPAATRTYVLRLTDRDGLQSTFAASFVLDATLRVDGAPIRDGDDVSPVANLSVMLVSPAPLDPRAEVTITVNGIAQGFTPVAAPGDTSGREWILSWDHGSYPKDNYVVEITVRGVTTLTRRFTVSSAVGDLRIVNLLAFPNPFDNDGTAFSYQLVGSEPTDVRISVYTISGRRIWSRDYRSQALGYHQEPWNGNDDEGDPLANGVYFYRLNASTPSGRHASQIGRLIKLRKPRHVDIPTTP
jgi:hypothetical protein